MERRSRFFCSLIAAMLLVAAGITPAGGQEFRAFWADAFSPAIKSRQEVDDLLRRVRKAHCNAVFVQVRKSADAYYVSRYDPWAADNPERFDGLRYLIEQAHTGAPRIQVHAWINTCAVGRSHGNPHHVALLHPDWLSLSDKGENYDGEATKIDPGHPDAADLTFRVYMDVLRHYDVDGIHFDFVRYGGANWGYNPVSVARFNARYGRTGIPKPDDPLWQQWRRDQVTALVRKVYAMAAALKPQVAVSAATITWGKGPESLQEWTTKSAAMNRVFQDWRAWMEEGILDLNCMMSYYREAQHAAWYRMWLEWAKDHQYRRYAIPACGVWLNTIPDTFRQIDAVRRPARSGKRAAGVILYCYAATNRTADGREERYNEAFYEALSRDSVHGPAPFAVPADPPALSWKIRPIVGHVKGFVLDAASLMPVDGAVVTLQGPGKRSQVTDGTGFYAFVDLPAGTATLTVTAEGYAPRSIRTSISSGGVRTENVFVGRSSSPYQHSAHELLGGADGTPVHLAGAEVVGGTDQFIGRCFIVLPGSDVAIQVRPATPPVLPLQAGDVVALRGVLATEDGERVIRDASLRLVDMRVAARENSVRDWMPPGQGRPVGILVAPGVLRVRGTVTRVEDGSFSVDGPVPVEVSLSGRKDVGVEDAEAPLPPPSALSRVSVTGIVTLGKRDGKPAVYLHPRTFEDLREDISTAAVVLGMITKLLMGPAVMGIVYGTKRG